MQKNSVSFSIAISRSVCWAAFVGALVATSSHGQVINATWDRQALGQTVGGECGPPTNIVHWSVTYPNDNDWSQSQVLGETACGLEVIQPSNWSIDSYPNGTNFNVLIPGGNVVNLDVSVDVGILTLSGQLNIPSSSSLRANEIDLAGGTISGAFDNVSSLSLTNGSFAGDITNAASILSLGSGLNVLLNQSSFFNAGLYEQGNSGGLGLNGEGGGLTAFYNLSTGTFEFLNDSAVFQNNCCGVLLFQNQGLLWKGAGTSNSSIAITFDNLGGAIRVDSGTLTLANGGTDSNGTFTVAAGATLDLTGGSSPTWAGEISGAGGGRVVVGTGTVIGNPSLTLAFTNGLFDAAGGTLAGTLFNTGIVTSTGTNPTILANQSDFINQNLFQQDGSGGLGYNGEGGGLTAFNNMSSGVFQFLTDSQIFQNNCCGVLAFNNDGTVWKSAGDSNTLISIAFNNSAGTIQVDAGTLTLSGAGVNSNGAFVVASNALLDLTGGSNPSWQGQIGGGGGGQVVVGAGEITAKPSLTLAFTNGLFNTAGGALQGTYINVGIVTSVGTNATILANESVFNNEYVFTQSGSGGLGYNGAGGGLTAFNNLPGATFQFLNDNNADSSIFQNNCCGALAFNNQGALIKSTGPSNTLISVPFNNDGGTIEVNAGTLTLSGGGTSSNATFSATAGTALDLTGGSSPAWAGQMNWQGGSTGGNVLLTSGTIAARPSLALNFPGNAFEWGGGSFSGTVSNINTVNLISTNPAILANQSAFINQAAVLASGSGGLGLDGAGGGLTAFYNMPPATYKVLVDSPIFMANCCGTALFENQGMFWKNAGTDNSVVSIGFDNINGTIEVDKGQLTLGGGGSSSNATLITQIGGTLDLTGGNNSTFWTGVINGSGAGNVLLSSGAIIATPHTVLTLNCQGALFQWSGGTFAGTVSNTGVVNLTGSLTNILANQSDFYNASMIKQSGTGGLGLDGAGGGTTAFYNLPGATYQLLSDSPISLNNCCGTVFFENQGLLWKSGGTSNAAVTVDFDNENGTVQVDGGLLTLAGGGSSSNGTFTIAGGAAVDLTGGSNPTWAGKMSGSGAGSVFLSSGTITASPLLTLNLSSNLFQWTGGTFVGAVSNIGTATLNSANISILANQSAFYNNGLVIQAGLGGLGLNGEGGGVTAFYNLPGATYHLTGNGPISLNNCCGTVFFQNQGLLWKSAGLSNDVTLDFNSAGGTVKVDTGNVTLAGGGSSSNGTFTVAAGASVDLTGGSNPTWAGQMSGSGAGNVLFSAGTISASPSLTLALSNNLFQWTGGAFVGTVSNAGVVTLSGTNVEVLANQSSFFNSGLMVQTGSGGLGLNGAGGGATAFFNLPGGVYQFANDSSVTQNNCCGTLEFSNEGLVRKSGGANTSAIAIAFNNSNGSIEVDSGVLSLNGSPYSQGSGSLTVALGGSAGQSGQLAAGNVTLGGRLNVFLTNGFAPAVGKPIQIVSGSVVSGAFSSVNLPGGMGVTYSTNAVYVVANSAVNQSIQISSPQLLGTNLNFGFQTVTNLNYTVQQNTNLGSTNWFPYTNFVGNGSNAQFNVPVGNAPQQFFRVRAP